MTNLCKILLVDDEYLLRQGLKYLCNWEEKGFTIVGEASNGQEALSLVKEYKPHIVITDIVMPLIDGVELVKLIKNFNEAIEIIVLSSYGDFDYVKTSFKYGVKDYILKPKLQPDELLPLLEKLKKNIRLTENTYTKNTPEIQLSIELSNLLNGFGNFSTILSFSKDLFLENTFVLIQSELSSVCQTQTSLEVLKSYFCDSIYFEISTTPNYYTLLVNLSSDCTALFLENLTALIANLSPVLPRMHFALSHFFTSILDVKLYYEQVHTLLGYSFYFEDKPLLQTDTLKSVQNTIIFDFNTYYTYLECLDSTKAKDLITCYIKNVSKHLDCDPLSLKKNVENIIYSTIHFMEKLGFDIVPLNILKITCLKEIERTSYTSELAHLAISLINHIFIEIASQPDRAHLLIIDKVTSYIKENYNKQISLATVAESLHLNYYYLSSYFNNHAKESFTDCINKIRIQKAKELLQSTTFSIAEVSESVGYTDQSYFGKVFKKLIGTTPSAYRKKLFFTRRLL